MKSLLKNALTSKFVAPSTVRPNILSPNILPPNILQPNIVPPNNLPPNLPVTNILASENELSRYGKKNFWFLLIFFAMIQIFPPINLISVIC